MCEMINLFIPVASPVLPEPVRGLAFETGGELQRDFRDRYGARGAIVSAFCGYCLCGFEDWEALFEAARAIIAANRVDHVAVVHFDSGSRYELTEREVDPFDDGVATECAIGEVTILRPDSPEKRRHKQLVRALFARIGNEVTLRLKSGKILRGSLAAFDAESQTGRVANTPFAAAQVLEVL